jgi:hypothetical protein
MIVGPILVEEDLVWVRTARRDVVAARMRTCSSEAGHCSTKARTYAQGMIGLSGVVLGRLVRLGRVVGMRFVPVRTRDCTILALGIGVVPVPVPVLVPVLDRILAFWLLLLRRWK